MGRSWPWRPRRGALDIYEVLEDPDHPVFLDVGRLLFSLVVSQPEWIYRRVDTLRFVKERHFWRHMSVDCRVPPEVVDYAEELELDRFVVPLRFVMRQSLLAFDLRVDNLPVPLLTRKQNIMATRALLHAAAEQYGVDPGREEVHEVLAEVASADIHAADRAFEIMRLEPADAEAKTVEEDLLRWAVSTFDRNYLLLADVPLQVVRNRTIFKITQELTYPAGPLRLSRGEFRTRIGWDPLSLVFDTPDVTTAESYHFQFIPPDGLAISDGALLAGDVDQPELFGTNASRSSVLGLNAHAASVPTADSYHALVQVRPSPDGLLRATAASAALSTVLLLLASTVADRVNIDTQIGPSTALLLVIPGALSTFLARPGEHSLAAHALRGVRTLTFLSAATTYLAAAMLVLGLDDSTLRTGWLVLGVLSAIPAVGLVVAVRRCRLSMRQGSL